MPKATLSTTAPFGFEIDPQRFLEAFKALGCTSCQFFRNREKPPTVGDALAVSQRVGLPYDSIHGVFGADIDPSSPDRAQRDHALKVFEDEGRLALDLGGPMVVVHPSASGPPGGDATANAMAPEEARRRQQARWPHLHDFLSRLAEVGHKLSVMYLIENLMFDCELGHDPAQLAEHVMRVGSPWIRLCLDTGHAHATMSKTSAAGAAAVGVALRVCASAISYLHVHDNDGTRDLHLMPGRGAVRGGRAIDWSAVSEALRITECRAIRMLEVFEDPALSGAGIGERVRGWMG